MLSRIACTVHAKRKSYARDNFAAKTLGLEYKNEKEFVMGKGLMGVKQSRKETKRARENAAE
jgi:hypothetical protein